MPEDEINEEQELQNGDEQSIVEDTPDTSGSSASGTKEEKEREIDVSLNHMWSEIKDLKKCLEQKKDDGFVQERKKNRKRRFFFLPRFKKHYQILTKRYYWEVAAHYGYDIGKIVAGLLHVAWEPDPRNIGVIGEQFSMKTCHELGLRSEDWLSFCAQASPLNHEILDALCYRFDAPASYWKKVWKLWQNAKEAKSITFSPGDIDPDIAASVLGSIWGFYNTFNTTCRTLTSQIAGVTDLDIVDIHGYMYVLESYGLIQRGLKQDVLPIVGDGAPYPDSYCGVTAKGMEYLANMKDVEAYYAARLAARDCSFDIFIQILHDCALKRAKDRLCNRNFWSKCRESFGEKNAR